MSGPRYGGRGRSKCRIRNESIIGEGHNHFKRAPRQTSACARPATALHAWPFALGRPLGPGGSPPSPRWPSALMGTSSWASARRASALPLPQRTPRSPRAARTARGTGWPCGRAISKHPFELCQARAPRCCGCGSAAGGSARTARRSASQGGGGGGEGGRATSCRGGHSASMRGQAQWMWPCCLGGGMYEVGCILHGCPRLWPGYCLGGGMYAALLGRWQVGAVAATVSPRPTYNTAIH
jgi:hypothetical protein